MKHTTSHRHFAALAVGIVALLALAFAAPSSAKRIYKSVPTHVTYSATRAADGTVTSKIIFTSPNPRCLSADRWTKIKAWPGKFVDGFAALEYGGPWARQGRSHLSGSDGTGSPALNSGWSVPISPAGKSPFVVQAIWPGSLPTTVINGLLPLEDPNYKYTSTVAAASGVAVFSYAPPSKRYPYYKYAYNQGGNRIILKCGTTLNGGYKEFVF